MNENHFNDYKVKNVITCEHICGCKAKLLTISSKLRKKCSDCLLGNCKGLFIPQLNKRDYD